MLSICISCSKCNSKKIEKNEILIANVLESNEYEKFNTKYKNLKHNMFILTSNQIENNEIQIDDISMIYQKQRSRSFDEHSSDVKSGITPKFSVESGLSKSIFIRVKKIQQTLGKKALEQ